MTLVVKLLSTTSSIVVLSGSIFLGYYSFNNYENIATRLKKEGFEPLNTDETNSDWNVVFTSYKLATKNTFTGNKDTNLDETNLRKKCKDILNKNSENKDYLLAKQWCVKEKGISGILDFLNLRLLNTQDAVPASNISDLENWKEKLREYESNKPKNGFTVELNGVQDIKAKAIRDACKTLNSPELKTTTNEFNEKFQKIITWCTTKKSKV